MQKRLASKGLHKLWSEMGPIKNRKKIKQECAQDVRICFLNDYLCNNNILSKVLEPVLEEKVKEGKQASIYSYHKK